MRQCETTLLFAKANAGFGARNFHLTPHLPIHGLICLAKTSLATARSPILAVAATLPPRLNMPAAHSNSGFCHCCATRALKPHCGSCVSTCLFSRTQGASRHQIVASVSVRCSGGEAQSSILRAGLPAVPTARDVTATRAFPCPNRTPVTDWPPDCNSPGNRAPRRAVTGSYTSPNP